MNKDEQKKILFVISSFCGGGAEKVCLSVLKYINKERFITSVVLFEKKGVYLEQIPKEVDVYDLKKRSRFDFFKLIFRLAYRVYPKVKPDIVISFLSYANFINIFSKVFSLFYKPNIIINVRDYTSISLKFKRLKKIKMMLVRKIYPLADKVIVVSRGIKNDLVKNFNIPDKSIKVIHNGVNFYEIEKLSSGSINNGLFNEDIPTIIACGRLSYEKNYPLLLNAFSKVIKVSDAKLLILGKGEEKGNLVELSHSLGLDTKVFFLGFQKNPFKYISKANVFVLSSIYEGYPNVLVEAMACGTAVISTCCPSGPDEIIINGLNGLLVPVGDVKAMSEAILKLFKDKKICEDIAKAGKIKAKDFKIEKMVTEYENVFEDIIIK